MFKVLLCSGITTRSKLNPMVGFFQSYFQSHCNHEALVMLAELFYFVSPLSVVHFVAIGQAKERFYTSFVYRKLNALF